MLVLGTDKKYVSSEIYDAQNSFLVTSNYVSLDIVAIRMPAFSSHKNITLNDENKSIPARRRFTTSNL